MNYSVGAVKYLYKYVYKGPDRAKASLDNPEKVDEPKLYLDARYLSPPEACHRLFGFKMHDCAPPVVRLALHLPGEQVVYFNPGRVVSMEEVVGHAAEKNSSLMGFFKKCAEDPGARDLTYVQFPLRYVIIFRASV